MALDKVVVSDNLRQDSRSENIFMREDGTAELYETRVCLQLSANHNLRLCFGLSASPPDRACFIRSLEITWWRTESEAATLRMQMRPIFKQGVGIRIR